MRTQGVKQDQLSPLLKCQAANGHKFVVLAVCARNSTPLLDVSKGIYVLVRNVDNQKKGPARHLEMKEYIAVSPDALTR